MMWKSDHCTKSSPAHPKDCQWGSGLDSVVANPCVKMMSHAPWTPLSQSEPDESWCCHLGICPCHQGRTNPLMETPAHSVHSGRQLTDSLGTSCCWTWTWPTVAPQITALPPQAGTGGTRHDGWSLHWPLLLPWCPITLEQGKSGLIRPHDPLSSLQSPISLLPSKLKPFFWLAWLVVFLRLHSCSVPIPWVPFTLCVWKCSYCHY